MTVNQIPVISLEARRQLAELVEALTCGIDGASTTNAAAQATSLWRIVFDAWLRNTAVLDMTVEVFTGDHADGIDGRNALEAGQVIDVGFPKRFTVAEREVFTFCPEADPFAPVALRAYAGACRDAMPRLAAEFQKAADQYDHRNPTKRTVRFFDGPLHGELREMPTPLPMSIDTLVLPKTIFDAPDDGHTEHYDFELDTGGFVMYRHRAERRDSAASPANPTGREEGATT